MSGNVRIWPTWTGQWPQTCCTAAGQVTGRLTGQLTGQVARAQPDEWYQSFPWLWPSNLPLSPCQANGGVSAVQCTECSDIVQCTDYYCVNLSRPELHMVQFHLKRCYSILICERRVFSRIWYPSIHVLVFKGLVFKLRSANYNEFEAKPERRPSDGHFISFPSIFQNFSIKSASTGYRDTVNLTHEFHTSCMEKNRRHTV